MLSAMYASLHVEVTHPPTSDLDTVSSLARSVALRDCVFKIKTSYMVGRPLDGRVVLVSGLLLVSGLNVARRPPCLCSEAVQVISFPCTETATAYSATRHCATALTTFLRSLLLLPSRLAIAACLQIKAQNSAFAIGSTRLLLQGLLGPAS
jgi:hypothetical protein